MFDLSKLGDMTQMASEAKKMQEAQNQSQQKQTELLNKISLQLEKVISLLEK